MLGSKDHAVLSRPFCKKCLIGSIDAEELERSIDGLILLIPDDARCSGEEYEKRLEICDGCDALKAGTCGQCGCFVRLRAAKNTQGCPVGKWHPI